MRNFRPRGVDNKTDPFNYLGHPVPLFGREFNENQKIESNYLGIEIRDRDLESSDIKDFKMFTDFNQFHSISV